MSNAEPPYYGSRSRISPIHWMLACVICAAIGLFFLGVRTEKSATQGLREKGDSMLVVIPKCRLGMSITDLYSELDGAEWKAITQEKKRKSKMSGHCAICAYWMNGRHVFRAWFVHYRLTEAAETLIFPAQAPENEVQRVRVLNRFSPLVPCGYITKGSDLIPDSDSPCRQEEY